MGSNIDDSVITSDKIAEATKTVSTKTAPTKGTSTKTSPKKYTSRNFYFLQTFLYQLP